MTDRVLTGNLHIEGDLTVSGSSPGGGAPGSLTVKEAGSTVDASVTTLDFDGTAFNLTESPEDEINITLNLGTGSGQAAEGNHTHSYQPLDSDLTTIAGLTATTDSFMQAKSSAWASRTIAQVAADLNPALTLSSIGGAVTDSQVPNTITLDNITQITTRSHTSLSDIGTNTHAQIDTHIGASNPHAGSQPLDSDLTTIAGLTATTDNIIQSKSGAWASRTMDQLRADLPILTVTLGPFYINDIPGTATTQATLGYFNTATAMSRATPDMRMDRAGVVVGLILTSSNARTAGTATARVRIAGTGTTFNSGAVVLDGTNTLSDSSFVAPSAGVAFTAGQTIGADVVTSGWTPITANAQVHVVIQFNAF